MDDRKSATPPPELVADPAAKSQPTWLWAVAAFAAVVAIGLAINRPSPSTPAASQPGATAQGATPVQPAAAGPATAARVSKWSYGVSREGLDDAGAYTACLNSDNYVRPQPPYGDAMGQLCVRQHPQFGTDAFVLLNGDSQIVCRRNAACAITARFDGGAAQTFGATGAADNSSGVVFVTNATPFITALRGAGRTVMEVRSAGAGVQALTFNTAGLTWPLAGG